MESESGKGSTFKFFLPLKSVGDRVAAPAFDQLLGLSAALVCSSPSGTIAYRGQLEGLGFNVLCLEAQMELEKEDLECFDLLFIDAPNEKQRKQLAACEVPVVAFKMPAEEWNTDLPHVNKPVTREELEGVIRETLGAGGAPIVPSSVPESKHDSQELKILLADDSVVNQEVAVGLLEFFGHKVTCVDDGLQAVEKAAEEFDVILMDLEMPEMDGIEATRTIRARELGDTRIPIIAMTAHAIPEIERQCREAGMDGYLCKPVDPEALQKTLSELTGDKRNSDKCRTIDDGTH